MYPIAGGLRHDACPTALGLARNIDLFPFIRAHLLIHQLSRFETQLELEGTYDPLLGTLGDAIDTFAGQRIAEACALHFLHAIAGLLRKEFAADARTGAEGPYPFSVG